jgi:hypothetical protein
MHLGQIVQLQGEISQLHDHLKARKQQLPTGCNGHGVGPYFGRKMVAIWGFLSHGGTQIIHFVGGFFFPAIGASPFFPILRNLHIAF